MSARRLRLYFLLGLLVLVFSGIPIKSASPAEDPPQDPAIVVGRNVNMISGKDLPKGDPFLQRQNEPSLAVSTRNPMHVLAGANDYRTVDMSIPYEEIPGYEGTAAARDAWLGLYKSYDGGQSWISTLLPGFPLDFTAQGATSPLKAFGTAADPVIRAGTSGMFYYAGLAFNRNAADNSLFVARFIDNNNSEDKASDQIKYIDTKIIATGNIAQFIDKPWMAVDIPRGKAKTVAIGPLPGVPLQYIAAGNVYVAYSTFTGQDPLNPFSRVYFFRSTDSGKSWGKPTKLSESAHVNQGVTIAIAPSTGNVYVAWRRFARDGAGNSIMFCFSKDKGATFTKPVAVAAVQPFDQGTTATSFRTNSYPSLTVDHNGRVYLAWSQRGVGPGGDARIVVITTTNGVNWTGQQAVENHQGRGHQFMPTLSYAAGKVMAAWYDQRRDASEHWYTYISDEPGVHLKRHTTDVRAAQMSVGEWFGPSVQASRYLFWLVGDDTLTQIHYNPLNFPMFKEGTRPFHGDYIDLTPVPQFLPTGSGGWMYNTDPTNSPVFHAAWTDNRNVKPPADGNWMNYTPPAYAQPNLIFNSDVPCAPGRTGMRNQDVYTTSLTGGLIVGSPGNSKPLDLSANKHTFVVFAKNMTKWQKRFKLVIDAPWHVSASFKQFEDLDELQVDIAPSSSISRTVFANSDERKASFKVNVEEVDAGGSTVPGGLKGTVILNPEIENPEIENPEIENNELHNPEIENPEIENTDINNVIVLNPEIENPEIENTDIINPEIENPEIENPEIENPEIENEAVLNPEIENPEIENPEIENGSISDYTWKVSNAGNTTSAYIFKMISAGFDESSYPGFGFQLLIYRVHRSPVAVDCTLKEKHHDELIANIVGPVIFNPEIENPEIENPEIENPEIENASFWLAPGDQAYVTLRWYDPNKFDNTVFDPVAEAVEGVTTAQAVNSTDEDDTDPTPPMDSPETALTIYNASLPSGTQLSAYSTFLVALGGKPHYTWSVISGSWPADLSLNIGTGEISGIPTAAGSFTFTVAVTDSDGVSVSRQLTINIIPLTYTISGTITLGMSGLTNVVMTGLPGDPQTNAAGYYSATVNQGWTGTVTPELTGFTFTPPSQGYTNVMSNEMANYTAVSVIGPASQLVFTQQPNGGVGGVPWTVQPVVEVQDAAGNRVTTDNSTLVTLAISILNNPGNGSLSGITTVTVSSGFAVFSGLSINKGGYGYTLEATSSPTLQTATSETFSIEGFSATKNPLVNVMKYQTATPTVISAADKVLIAGGLSADATTSLSDISFYDPGTNTFEITGISMNQARELHTATSLLDGNILFVGGDSSERSAEIFDPGTGLFTSVADTINPHLGHRATLLQDGGVLVTGHMGTPANTAEIYKPLTRTFVSVGPMGHSRNRHTSTLLPNGKVLITGGYEYDIVGASSSTELYDPATGLFAEIAGGMAGGPRLDHQATLLDNGTVFITGGNSSAPVNMTAEIYDPTPSVDHPNGYFQLIGNMLAGHERHQAALLRDGSVLIMGGNASGAYNEIYDPFTSTFRETGPMSTYRLDGAAAVLPDGKVLITGGYQEEGLSGHGEVWNPPVPFPTNVIGGTITANGADVGGVMLIGLPGHPMTNAGGYYEGLVLDGWSGTVTPAKLGYMFDPPIRSYTNVTVALLGENYSPVICTVSTPNTPVGTATGSINLPYTFTTGGATDSLGHPVEYRLEWATGQYTSWSSSTAIAVTYNATGTYQVRAQARCQVNPSIISAWSSSKEVTIYASVSTIQGYVTYNGNPVTNMLDALGIEAEIILSDEGTHQRFPSSPSYNATTGFYSIPNIPQGSYGLEVRVEMLPKDGKHLPGDYDGIVNNILVPAGTTVVTQDARVEKLLHLVAPIDNSVLLPWPGPVFDLHISPVLMDWADLVEAAYYRYRVDQCTSDTYDIIYTTGDLDITPSQVSLTLPSSGPNDHYEFTLNAYNGSGLLVGRLMMEYLSGYGWDYRFRIATAIVPEINVR
jgi:hypothetical protein